MYMLTLSGMTGLLSLADILITNDTGPLHLAKAIKTPTIGIFWCGNAITGFVIDVTVNEVKACLHELLAQTEQDQVELEIVA